MSLSRDEAREIAATALILTVVMRVLTGVFKVVDELDGAWDTRSLMGQFLAPIGSTVGVLSLGLALLVVLSPSGAISPVVHRVAEPLAGTVAALGALAVLNSIVWGFDDIWDGVSFALMNGFAALVLAGAAWWILSNFDPSR